MFYTYSDNYPQINFITTTWIQTAEFAALNNFSILNTNTHKFAIERLEVKSIIKSSTFVN